MKRFAEVWEAIAATAKKLRKVGIVAEYLTSLAVKEASVSAVFLSGKPFPAWEETTLQVGGRLLWRVVSELSGWSDAELTAEYRKLGDVGAVAGEALAEGPRSDVGGQECSPHTGVVGQQPSSKEDGSGATVSADAALTILETESFFRKTAATRGPSAKIVLVRELLSRATGLEAKYLVKIMTGDLRIGLKESLV